jgi:hypothetical protein
LTCFAAFAKPRFLSLAMSLLGVSRLAKSQYEMREFDMRKDCFLVPLNTWRGGERKRAQSTWPPPPRPRAARARAHIRVYRNSSCSRTRLADTPRAPAGASDQARREGCAGRCTFTRLSVSLLVILKLAITISPSTPASGVGFKGQRIVRSRDSTLLW